MDKIKIFFKLVLKHTDKNLAIAFLFIIIFIIMFVSSCVRDVRPNYSTTSSSSSQAEQAPKSESEPKKEPEVERGLEPPDSASFLKGKNYNDVVTLFEKAGFTNVKTEPVADLVIGLFAEENEVDEVSIDGNTSFSSSDRFDPNAKVVIRYHAYESKDTKGQTDDTHNQENVPTEENPASEPVGNETDTKNADDVLTRGDCPLLNEVLSTKDMANPAIAQLASDYAGRTIEFDGRIDYIANYNRYKTRYDILVSAGDYNPDTQDGPSFKFENVGWNQIGDGESTAPEITMPVGTNVRVVAQVERWNQTQELFFLHLISITKR